MRIGGFSHLWFPTRVPYPPDTSAEEIGAYIDSRSLDYPSRLEDEFVHRAMNLGIESGVVLEIGARVGLIALKLLWQNDNLIAMGLDSSGSMIERARETAAAWDLGERAVFQVGDARHMRFKTGYFDLVLSDCSLHRFDDVTAVLAEVARVLKPKGALLIRDYQRPNRFRMLAQIQRLSAHYQEAMRPQFEAALQAAYTREEITAAVEDSGLPNVQIDDTSPDFITIERHGETDPGSWVTVREQYR